MILDTFYIHIGIAIIFFVIVYRQYIKALRLKASYDLYKIRDELVYLVASDVVTEDDKVFQFYYERINNILVMAPNVGLHDVLGVLFTNNRNDIKKAIEQNKRETHEVLKSDSMGSSEVREVVANYYCGVRMMMLSHSSIFKVSYLLSNELSYKLISSLTKPITRFILSSSKTYSDAEQVVDYAESEATMLRNKDLKLCRL